MMKTLGCTDSAKDCGNGAQQNGEVKKDILVFDVKQIESKIFVDGHRAGWADLPQAGDAGRNEQS